MAKILRKRDLDAMNEAARKLKAQRFVEAAKNAGMGQTTVQEAASKQFKAPRPGQIMNALVNEQRGGVLNQQAEYLRALNRYMQEHGGLPKAGQLAPATYKPSARGGLTDAANAAYVATNPATRQPYQALSMSGYNLTDAELQKLVSGQALIPNISGWEYLTHDKQARAAVERAAGDTAALLEAARDAGRFDVQGNLTPANLHMPSTEYIQQMSGEYQQMIDNRNTAWNLPANMAWANEIGNAGDNWTLQTSAGALAYLRENEDYYSEYGDEALYRALRDYAQEEYGADGEGWDSLRDGLAIDLLKLDHVANGGDLATFDAEAALENLNEQPDEVYYGLYNTYMPYFAGEAAGFGSINWSQPGALAAMFDTQETRLNAMQDELAEREEFSAAVNGIHQQILTDGYALDETTLNGVRARINVLHNAPGEGTGYGNLMTAEELTIYAWLLEQDPSGNEAEEYFGLLQDTQLYTRRGQVNAAETQLYATDPLFAVPTWVGSVGAGIADLANLPDKLYHAATGEDDPNARWHDMANYRSNVRNAQGGALEELGGEFWGPVARTGYNALSGAADFGAAMLTGQGIAAIGGGAGATTLMQNATGVIMSLEAASGSLTDTADTELPGVWRWAMAAGAAMAEAVTEKYSIEALFKDPRNVMQYVMQNVVAEGSEEMASDVLNTVLDFAINGLAGTTPEMVEQYNELAAQGRTDAFTQVLSDKMGELLYDGLIGAATGGIVSAPVAVGSYARSVGQGRSISTTGNTENLVQLGLAMDQESQSYQQAKEIAAQMGLDQKAESGDAGKGTGAKKIRNAKLGQLYSTMLQETHESYRSDIRQMAVEAVESEVDARYAKLKDELGVERGNQYTSGEIAEAIVEAMESGKEPVGAIGRYIMSHMATRAIYREFTQGKGTWTRQLQERQIGRQLQSVAQRAQIAATTTKKVVAAMETAAATSEAITKETQAAVEDLTRRHMPSEALSRMIVTVQEGAGEVQSVLKRVEREKNELRLIVEREGKEMGVALSEVAQVSGSGVARILEYAKERVEITAEEINTMVNALFEAGEKTVRSAEVIAAFEAGVNAGFAGMEKPVLEAVTGRTTAKAAKALGVLLDEGYRQGLAQAAAAEATRRAGVAANRVAGSGKVSYMGDVANAAEVVDTGMRHAVTTIMQELNDQQQAAVEMISQVARVTGVNVVLYRSSAEKGASIETPNGFYDANTKTIFVDVNSGMSQGGETLTSYAIAKTFAHELTHYIETSSRGGYSKLREVAHELLAKRGENYADMLNAKIRESSRDLTRAEAEAELIADACEMMLRDTTAISRLAAKDRTLAERVRQFVTNFVTRLRDAFAGVTPGAREAAALMEMRNGVLTYLDGIQQAWDDALIEAVNFNRSGATVTTSDAVADPVENAEQTDGREMIMTGGYTVEAGRENANEALGAALSRQGAQISESDTQRLATGIYDQIAEAAQDEAEALAEVYRSGAQGSMTDWAAAEQEAGDRFVEALRSAGRSAVAEAYQGADADLRAALEEYAQEAADYIAEARVAEVSRAEAMDSAAAPAVVDAKSDSAYMPLSQRTWMTSEYMRKRDRMAQEIARRTGVTHARAIKWITDVTGVAQMIAANKELLDYVPSEFSKPFKSNPEYGGTIDMSTLCPKRAIATGTLDAIQNILGDVALDRNDFLRIREMMKERNYEVACGLCFVESSRANMAKYVNEFIESYRRKHPEAEISMPMFNTVEGLEATREERPELYAAFEEFMNKLAQRKPKLFEKRSEYTDEILKAFVKDERVADKNLMGGLRIQSFSDFEVIHLIDMMQVIMDMSAVGLAGQAYTKQPNFAWALGDTNLKINLSLIAKDVDADGKLIFDPVEGMNPEEARKLRERYSKNVGTIVVVFTNAQLKAAMADPFVDFIIPFHRSQWQKKDYGMLGLPKGTRDYTLHQNERHRWQDDKGKWHVTKHEDGNLLPNAYWDFNLSGKENAQRYLDLCFEQGRIPKFPFLLDKGSDGHYHLKEDGSTDGYWKLLIDFKMYDNDGVGSPQLPVVPNFNMDECYRMLKEYKGGHEKLPVAQDVVDDFVKEYRGRKGVKVQTGEKVTLTQGNVMMSERRVSNVSIRKALKQMRVSDDMTETEKVLLKRYQEDLAEYEGYQAEISTLVDGMKAEKTEAEKSADRNRMEVLKSKQRRVHKRMLAAESSEGFANMMATTTQMVRMFARSNSLQDAAANVSSRMAEIADEMNVLNATLKRTQNWNAKRVAESLYDKDKLNAAADHLKKVMGTPMSRTAIKERLVGLSMAMISGEKIDGMTPLEMAEQLATDLRVGSLVDENDTLGMLRELLPHVTINERILKELKAQGITLQAYKSVVGKVTSVSYDKDGHFTDLLAESEANSYYGTSGVLDTYLGGVNNSEEALIKLYDVVDNVLKRGENLYDERYGAEYRQADVMTVLDAMSSASLIDAGTDTVKGVLDALLKNEEADSKLAMRAKELRNKSAAAKNLAARVSGQLADIGADAGQIAKYYATLERERRLLEEKAQLETMQTRMDKEMGAWYQEREVQEKLRQVRDSIRRMVGWMDKRIRKESSGKLIQEELKPVVEEMARVMIQAQDKGIFSTFAKKELREIARVYNALDALDGRNTSQVDELLQQDMTQLLENIKRGMKLLGEIDEDSRLERMYEEYRILSEVHDLIGEIWHAVNETNQIFLDGRQMQLETVGNRLGGELKAKGLHSIRDGLGGKVWESVKRFVRDGNLTAPYFFRLIGVDTLTEMNDGLLHAQAEYARLKDSAQAVIAKLQKDYNYWSWRNNEPLTFRTEQGQRTNNNLHEITLTVEEALSLWAIWKREQISTPLFTSSHLGRGGFTLVSKKRRVNGRVVTDSTAHKMSELDMKTIDHWLTDEMKGYARAMIKYMSQDMAEIGNRTSMHLYGVRKFKENFYFPMKSQRDQLAQSSDAGAKTQNDSNRIAHKSFTKARVNMAANPLQIGSFTEVAAQHINEMMLYGTFAEPIEAFNRVLNFKYVEADGEDETVMYALRGMFEQAYGADMKQYLESYLAAVNGGVRPERTPTEKVTNQLLSTFKKTATMGSLSVAFQQPTSLIRALAEIDGKYFGSGRISKAEYEELRKYSGTALIKEAGGIDMNGTRSMTEQLMGTPEADYKGWQAFRAAFGVGTPKGERAAIAMREWDTLFGLAAQKADQMTWTYLWGVVKAETADKHPGMDKQSDAFLEMAGKRFDEVINLTQVYDSTLVRSPNMRAKGIMQYAMAFRAEPTLALNMLMDASRKQPGRKAKMTKALAIYIVSAIITSMAAAIPSAGRDDDKEKPWVEKFLAQWGNRLGGWSGNLNPAALVPIVSDVMSLLDGYDVERADMTVLSDLFKEGQRLTSGYYKDNPYKGFENVMGAVGNMLGVPVKNLMREGRAIWNTATGLVSPPRAMSSMGMMHDAAANYIVLPDRDNGYYYNRLYRALLKGDRDDAAKVTEYLTQVQGKTQQTVNTGVKGVVRDQVEAGKMTEEQAQAFLLANGLAESEKAAYETVDKWREGSEGYSVYNGIDAALMAGDLKGTEAEAEVLIANGWDAEDVRSQIRSRANDAYMAGTITQEQLKTLHQRSDWDENRWYWHFEELDWGKSNGSSTKGWTKYMEYIEAVKSGTNLRNVTQKYLQHGVEKGTLKSELRKAYRDEYRSLSKSNRTQYAELRARLATALEMAGYSRQDALEYLDGWLE